MFKSEGITNIKDVATRPEKLEKNVWDIADEAVAATLTPTLQRILEDIAKSKIKVDPSLAFLFIVLGKMPTFSIDDDDELGAIEGRLETELKSMHTSRGEGSLFDARGEVTYTLLNVIAFNAIYPQANFRLSGEDIQGVGDIFEKRLNDGKWGECAAILALTKIADPLFREKPFPIPGIFAEKVSEFVQSAISNNNARDAANLLMGLRFAGPDYARYIKEEDIQTLVEILGKPQPTPGYMLPLAALLIASSSAITFDQGFTVERSRRDVATQSVEPLPMRRNL